MNIAETSKGFTLILNRTFSAPREAVFDAWINIDAICQWFAPDPNMTTVVDELDAREGGRYQFQMIEAEGNTYIVTGEYVKINHPEQLIFTWAWIHGDDKTEMLVTLDFIDVDGATELKLTHERLPSQESSDHHSQGWTACLARLAEAVETKSIR